MEGLVRILLEVSVSVTRAGDPALAQSADLGQVHALMALRRQIADAGAANALPSWPWPLRLLYLVHAG